MKKIVFTLTIMSIFGCSQKLVQKSDMVVVTNNHKHIYVLNNDVGSIIYNVWKNKSYGDTIIPHLKDSISFQKLVKKSTLDPTNSILIGSQGK